MNIFGCEFPVESFGLNEAFVDECFAKVVVGYEPVASVGYVTWIKGVNDY